MKYKLSVNAQNILCVSGTIDLTNVMAACGEGKTLIDTLATVRVDLSGVEQADSSSLAMLVDWIRAAKAQHKGIIFSNMPQFMLDLGRVCGVDSILPVNKILEFQS
jgi:anti-anti-sigma factor